MRLAYSGKIFSLSKSSSRSVTVTYVLSNAVKMEARIWLYYRALCHCTALKYNIASVILLDYRQLLRVPLGGLFVGTSIEKYLFLTENVGTGISLQQK
jgi:hypothetical protein